MEFNIKQTFTKICYMLTINCQYIYIHWQQLLKCKSPINHYKNHSETFPKMSESTINFYFMYSALNLENILIFQVFKDKELILELFATHKRLLYIFVQIKKHLFFFTLQNLFLRVIVCLNIAKLNEVNLQSFQPKIEHQLNC